MQLPAFLQSLELFYFLCVIINDLLIVCNLPMENILLWCLDLTSDLLSLLLLLLEVDIDDFLELLQDLQQLLMFSKQLLLIHPLVVIRIFDVLHHHKLSGEVGLLLGSLRVGSRAPHIN
jgi:hypothetical protein